VKKDQILLTFSSIDFSFIAEKHLSAIFDQLAQLQVPINIMQNSALNFSILADRKKVKLEAVKLVFEGAFKVKYNEGLELVTIRHYNQATIEQMTASKEIILEQRTRNTARFVLRNLE
jgi:aspartate kinase